MDPFALLGLEKSFSLDAKALEKSYFAAQKRAHPDQVIRSSGEERAKASEQSTAINQAYLLLKDPLKRAEYLLKEQDVTPLTHDPSFLAEVMRWKEELDMGKDLEGELTEREKKLLEELADALEQRHYDVAQSALYQLQYIQGTLKEIKKYF